MTKTCGRCGKRIRLIRWGLHFKWVTGKDTWKCEPTAEFPVRSHYPLLDKERDGKAEEVLPGVPAADELVR